MFKKIEDITNVPGPNEKTTKDKYMFMKKKDIKLLNLTMKSY
jgi:hypothetical protein